MQDSQLGVWIAHGEGRFTFKTPTVLDKLKENGQICLQYVDDDGKCTEKYPMNPNGSPRESFVYINWESTIDRFLINYFFAVGIASVCSLDGRHLAIMPHPERCTLKWQCAFQMKYGGQENSNSPWQRMFDNAYMWASEHVDM